ncbi:AraC family transcriptional regulator [Paraglaciecola sp. MB-3u-78]|uniref:AraC family transcriptional regulator n=1 Tax=Paraglaciecola sp. MB-3u-78 TaxID=2058332 RepID=UPI000C34ED2D|nr:AraC family transcriptional regulator [Paraglaciecola sp. MB-3u-78]PKG92948.1 AraC family transcriptional regulator [Paraglaciecola sp. MB-3u-78]
MDNKKWQDKLELGPLCHEQFVDIDSLPEIARLGIQLSGISTMVDTFHLQRSDPDNHTVIYTLAGQGLLKTPEGEFYAQKNSMITIPARSPFSIQVQTSPWKIVWFNLNNITRWQSLYNRQPLQPFNYRAMVIFHLLGLIFHEKNKSLSETWLKQLEIYLDESLNKGVTATREQDRLEDLFHTVNSQLHVNWTIKRLSDMACYSAAHMHRLCQQRFARSPIQQVIFLRMARAKYLLIYTNLSISQIAEQVGYPELSNFSKRFKKSIGISPATFRKSVLIDHKVD